MNAAPGNRVGTVYQCAVCGAEVVVVRGGEGALAPVCCNLPMGRAGDRVRLFYCPLCGAELAVIRDAGGELAPLCCNEPMRMKSAA